MFDGKQLHSMQCLHCANFLLFAKDTTNWKIWESMFLLFTETGKNQRGVVSERNNDVKTFVGIEAVS